MRFLFWLKRPAQVRPKEIDTLKRWLNDYAPDSLVVTSYLPGEELKILSGPFQDQEGVVVEQRGQSMVLYLQELQLQVKVDLRQATIQAIAQI